MSPVTIERIRQTMNSVAIARKKIHNHAAECKSSISSSVSRHMETLRSRELWLLHQVDILRQAKDEMLRRQEMELLQVLGSLDACSLLGTVPSSLQCRLQALDFQPVESTIMMFAADDNALRQHLREFGHVHDGTDEGESDDSSDESEDEDNVSVMSRAKSAGRTPEKRSELLQYFAEVQRSPLDKWLLASDVETIRAKYEIGASYPAATMKYFREACNDVKHWLKQHEQHVREDGNEDKVTKVAEVVDPDERVRVLEQAVTRYFNSVASSGHVWLKSQVQGQAGVAANQSTSSAGQQGTSVPALQLCCRDDSAIEQVRNWSPLAGTGTTICSRLSYSSPFDNAKSEPSPFTCSVDAGNRWLHPCCRDNSSPFVCSGNRSWLVQVEKKEARDVETSDEKRSSEWETEEKLPNAHTAPTSSSPFAKQEHHVKNLSLKEWLHASRLPLQFENSEKCLNHTLTTSAPTSASTVTHLQREEGNCNSDWTRNWVLLDPKTASRETETNHALTLCSQAAQQGAWCKFDDKQEVDAWLSRSSERSATYDVPCDQEHLQNAASVIKFSPSALQWSGECRR